MSLLVVFSTSKDSPIDSSNIFERNSSQTRMRIKVFSRFSTWIFRKAVKTDSRGEVDCSEIWVFKDRNNCKHFELSKFIIIELILMLHYWLSVWKPHWSQLFTSSSFFAWLVFAENKNLSRVFPLFAIKKKLGNEKRKNEMKRNTEEKSEEMMYEF